MNPRLLSVTVCALLLFVLSGESSATDPEARKVLDTFLKHMNANAPVAGRFRIETIPDPVRQEKIRKKARASTAKQGYEVGFGPEKPVLNCRWAWDGAREMVDALSDSNIFETFFRTPEAYLQQTDKLSFNLDKPGPVSVWRPASFYFLWGGVHLWSDALKGSEFSIDPAPAGSPVGCVVLVAKGSRWTIHLLVDRARGIFHGHRTWLADGTILGEVTVEKLTEHPDGRVFPTAARAKVFDSMGNLINTFAMSGREVTFPKSGSEFEKALDLNLPKGALIYDLLLSREIQLKQATSAMDVLAGTVPSQPAEFKVTAPPTRTQTAGHSGSWFWPAVAFFMSLPLGIYLGYRAYTVFRGAERQ